jgi:integrase
MISITIQWMKRKSGKTGYLIIRTENQKSIWEPLGLKLTGNVKADKKIMDSAELIKASRIIEIRERGYEIPQVLNNRDFLSYYKKVIDERPEYERRSSVHKHLVAFAELHNEKITFKDLNENFWNRFKKYLVEERDHSQYTIHTVLSILKAILNRAVREEVISKNPLQHVTEKRPKSTRTYLTLEELQSLNNIPCASEEVKKAFLFSCYTGLRKSDVENLKKENIIGNNIVLTMKKTKDSITLPFDEKALKYLPALEPLKNDDLLFHLPASSTVNGIIHGWAAAAKIPKRVSFHTSRHTYATLHLTYGTSIEVLKELLGHKDVRETQIYAKIIDRKKVEAVMNLPEL